MFKRLFISYVLTFTTLIGAAGCSTMRSSPPTQTPLPPTTTTPTLTPSPTASPTIEPTKVITAADLVPMYKISNTSSLQEEDIYSELDIMTNAEQELRDIGFGDELDKITEDLLTYAGRNIREHTFIPKYALNTSVEEPVYSIMLYDQTCGCFLFPSYGSEESADSLSLIQLTVPAGLSEGGEIRLVPTKTGIVPGAFYNKTILLGWFDFDKWQWQLSQSARRFLEGQYAMLNTQATLELNLSNWLSGVTIIPTADIFEKSAGRPLKFNYYNAGYRFNSFILEHYYGVLLGMSIKDDNLFAFVGFEDVSSKRYYLAFNLGIVSDENCDTWVGTISSNLGDFHYGLDQYTIYQCDTLRLVLGNFVNKPILVQQQTGVWEDMDYPESLADEIKAQGDYALSVAEFIYFSSSTPIGSYTFEGRINPPPGSVTAEVYPKSFLTLFVKE